MQALDTDVRGEDASAEVRDESCANLSHFLVVVFVWLQLVQERLRHRDLRKEGRFLEAIPRLHGHDAGDDRDGNAGSACRLHPLDEHVHVVEHLREDEVGAGVDLRLEVSHLPLPLIRW